MSRDLAKYRRGDFTYQAIIRPGAVRVLNRNMEILDTCDPPDLEAFEHGRVNCERFTHELGVPLCFHNETPEPGFSLFIFEFCATPCSITKYER